MMRIRVYRAWASNNSGAYVLLGRFRSVEVAETALRDLRDGGIGPHDGDVAGEELRYELLGEQVLIEGYAADMPPVFCAWVAKHGGHVQAELIHAHGPVVLRAHAWASRQRELPSHDAVRAETERFVTAIHSDLALAELMSGRGHEVPRRVHTVAGGHGGVEIVCAPHRGLLDATQLLRALAKQHGFEMCFDVFEWPGTATDSDPAEVLVLDARQERLVVAIDEIGERPDELRRALVEVIGISPLLVDVHLRPDSTQRRPVLEAASRAQAELVVRLLRHLGAKAHVRIGSGEPLDL